MCERPFNYSSCAPLGSHASAACVRRGREIYFMREAAKCVSRLSHPNYLTHCSQRTWVRRRARARTHAASQKRLFATTKIKREQTSILVLCAVSARERKGDDGESDRSRAVTFCVFAINWNSHTWWCSPSQQSCRLALAKRLMHDEWARN